jgi:hypothetical protein
LALPGGGRGNTRMMTYEDWSDDDLQDYYAAIDEAKREDGDDGS